MGGRKDGMKEWRHKAQLSRLTSILIAVSVVLVAVVSLMSISAIFKEGIVQGEESEENDGKMSLEEVNWYSAADVIYDFEVVEDLVYVGRNRNGMSILRLHENGSYDVLGEEDTNGNVVGIDVQGNFSYLACGQSGLCVMNCSNLSNPEIMGWKDDSTYANDIAVQGNLAVVGEQDYGLYFYNITNNADPQRIGGFQTGKINRFCLVGDLAYAATKEGGLQIVNISNTSDPQLVGSWGSGEINSVDVQGDLAYVMVANTGLYILNVSNPASPVRLGMCSTGDHAYSVSMSKTGDLAYVADGFGGCDIVDVSNPSEPKVAASLDPGGFGECAGYVNGHMLMGSNDYALYILRIGPGVSIGEIAPSPTYRMDDTRFLANGSGPFPIVRYVWRSSIAGEFYNGTERDIVFGNLPNQTQEIFLKVMDSRGIWSPEASSLIVVHDRPTARISLPTGQSVNEGGNIIFSGEGRDDGPIRTYRWVSNIDGVLYEGRSRLFSLVNLSVGEHEITLLVEDYNDAWSLPASTSVTIRGESPETWPKIEITQPSYNSFQSGMIRIAGRAWFAERGNESVEVRTGDGLWKQVDNLTYQGGGQYQWECQYDSTVTADIRLVIQARAFNGSSYSNNWEVRVYVHNTPEKDDSQWGPTIFGIDLFASVFIIIFISICIYGSYYYLFKWNAKKKEIVRNHPWLTSKRLEFLMVFARSPKVMLFVVLGFYLLFIEGAIWDVLIFLMNPLGWIPIGMVTLVFFWMWMDFSKDERKKSKAVNERKILRSRGLYSPKTPYLPSPHRSVISKKKTFGPPTGKISDQTVDDVPTARIVTAPEQQSPLEEVGVRMKNQEITATMDPEMPERPDREIIEPAEENEEVEKIGELAVPEEAQISEKDRMLNSVLDQVHKYGFLGNWDLDRLRQEMESEFGEVPAEEENEELNEWLEYSIVGTFSDGFHVDWRFSSEDVIWGADRCLKKYDLAFEKGDPPAPDNILDEGTGRRETWMYLEGEEIEVEFTEPRDIIRMMNEVLAFHDLSFLEQGDRGDSQGFVLIANDLKETLIEDNRFTFKEII